MEKIRMIFRGDQVGFGRLAEALRADLGCSYGEGRLEDRPRHITKPVAIIEAMHLYAAPGRLHRVYEENGHGDLLSVHYEVVGQHGGETLFRLTPSPHAQIRVEVAILPVSLPLDVLVPPSQFPECSGDPGISYC
jgi:hypothetical protein